MDQTTGTEDTQDQGQSKDPLDQITDPDELRAEAKKYRGIASRKPPKAPATQDAKPVEQKENKDAEPNKPADSQTNPLPTPATEQVTAEDLLRTTKGYSDETLAELRAIAKGKGINLFQAQEDPLFTAYLEKQQAEDKSAKAKLGASNSSGKSAPKRGFNTPGLSDTEHKDMWKEKMGR